MTHRHPAPDMGPGPIWLGTIFACIIGALIGSAIGFFLATLVIRWLT